MARVALSLWGLDIYWYGITMASAMLLGLLLAMFRESRLGLPKDTALSLALPMIPAALLGARLYFVVFSWHMFKGQPLSIFNFRLGGLALYGAVIGGVLAGFVFSRVTKISFWKLADLVIPSLALGQGIGRWGNFFNQEAYGVAVANPILQFFPVSVFIEADQTWHYATFFYESVWCLFIAAFLTLLIHKRLLRRSGDSLMLYFLLYGAERAVVEGLRTDSLYFLNIRVSQLLSAALVAGAVLWLFLRARRHLPRPRGALPVFLVSMGLLCLVSVLPLLSGMALFLRISLACLGMLAILILFAFQYKREPLAVLK